MKKTACFFPGMVNGGIQKISNKFERDEALCSKIDVCDQLAMGGRLVGNWLTHLASLFVCVEKTTSDELDGGLLDLEAAYMEMHTKDLVPLKQKINWKQYEMQTPTSMHLPNIKPLLANSAYCLLLQCFLPEMRKCYRSRSQDNQMHRYLLTREAAILVQDGRLLIFGDERMEQTIQQSVNLDTMPIIVYW